MSKRMRVYREGAFDYSIVWENDFCALSREIGQLKPEQDLYCGG